MSNSIWVCKVRKIRIRVLSETMLRLYGDWQCESISWERDCYGSENYYQLEIRWEELQFREVFLAVDGTRQDVTMWFSPRPIPWWCLPYLAWLWLFTRDKDAEAARQSELERQRATEETSQEKAEEDNIPD